MTDLEDDAEGADLNFVNKNAFLSADAYINIQLAVVNHGLVTGNSLKTYLHLVSYAYGKKRTCFPSRETIAIILDISVDSVDRHLRELRAVGLIDWKVRGNNKTNMYYLLDIPDEFYKEVERRKKLAKENRDRVAPAILQGPATAILQDKVLKEEELKDSLHTTYEQANACHAPSTIAYQAGSLKEAPKEQLQSLYANSTNEMFSLVSDLGLPPKYEPEEDSIAGISLKSSKTLSSLLKSYQKKDAKTRGWKYLEIDYLRAWEIVLPSVKASRFPNYTAQFKNEDGTIEFVGQKLAGQLKNLTDKNGYEFMKGYIEWCVFHWNQLRDKRKWMSNTPNILQIVKSFSTFSPFYQTGKITDYVPQKQVAEEKRERKVEEWIPPDEPGDLSKLFG